jgi:hypothetical protein
MQTPERLGEREPLKAVQILFDLNDNSGNQGRQYEKNTGKVIGKIYYLNAKLRQYLFSVRR